MNINQDQIDSLVRTAAKIAGGILTAHGLTGAATVLNASSVEVAIGGLILALLGAWSSHKSNATPPATAAAVPEAGAQGTTAQKAPPVAAAIIGLLLLSLPAKAQTTNSYYAPGFEVGGGVAQSFANVKSKRNAGMDLQGTWWQTLHTGTTTRAGVNDLRRPNPLIFDYTEVGQSLRAVFSQPTNGVLSLKSVLCRFSPAGTIYGGKSYVDGGTYTKVEVSLEYKFTRSWGVNLAVNDSFSTSYLTKGPAFLFNSVWSF